MVEILNLSDSSPSADFVVHVRGEQFIGARRETPSKLQSDDGKKISGYCASSGLHFNVVTNDVNYASSIFPVFNNENVFQGKNALEDFKYLCLAKNLYISNSTFTVWAALCAKHKFVQQIFAPSNFIFKDILQPDQF